MYVYVYICRLFGLKRDCRNIGRCRGDGEKVMIYKNVPIVQSPKVGT